MPGIYVGLFLWTALDSNLRLFVEYKNSRRFGGAK